MSNNSSDRHPEVIETDLLAPPYVIPFQIKPTFESHAYGIITDGAYKRVMLSRHEETGIYSALHVTKVTNSIFRKGRYINHRGVASIAEYIRCRFDELYLGDDLRESFVVGDHALVQTTLTTRSTDISTFYNVLINDIVSIKNKPVHDTVFSLQGVEGRKFNEKHMEKAPRLLEHAAFIEESTMEAIKLFVRRNMKNIVNEEVEVPSEQLVHKVVFTPVRIGNIGHARYAV